MDTSFNKVYLYENIRPLLVLGDTFCLCKDNGPMHKHRIKAHKGIDNKLVFRALGPDRAPVDVACDQQIYARIIDPASNLVVLETLATTGPARGIITVILDSGDTEPLHVGVYHLVLIRAQNFVSNVDDYYLERPLFADFDDNIGMELELTEQAYKSPKPSAVLLAKDWTPDMITCPDYGIRKKCYYTKSIPGGRVSNHVDAVHTFSVNTTGFTGTLEVWGTLEESPGPYLNDRTWFKIYPSTMSQDIEFYDYTGTQAWSFSANFMWLKFRYIPSTQLADPGTVNKLIVRT